MSDLQSDLRRLQEILWPEPWRPSSDQHDDHDIYAGDVKVAGNYDHEEGGIVRREDRDALVKLRNLLPRILTALAAPAVKPLVWEKISEGALCAATPFGLYVISGNSWWFAGERAHEAPTLEAAQSAAWQHWSERIGGAISNF